MYSIEVNRKKVVAYGAAIIFLQMIVFSILWANPLVIDLLAQYASHPAVKSYEFIGGEQSWKLARMLFHIGFMSICIYFYIALCRSIPGGVILKGVYFGTLIGFLRFIPEAFNLWTLVAYPETLIMLRLLLGFVSFLIFGMLVSVVLEKSKAIVLRAVG